MAEVGVVASVIAIIQVADRIAGLCKFYIESLSDTPSDIRAILIEISTLKTLFETLRFLITSDTSSSVILKLLSDQNGPVEGCLGCVTELEKLFPPASTHVISHSTGHSKRRELNAAYATLVWPLRAAPNAQRYLQRIIQYKASINLILTTELTQDIKNIKEKNDEIHNILTDSQRQEVYKWLQHTDPSPLHNKAYGNYEAGTGNWILRSPSWIKWLEGQHRCLWIHGIPGAGKTILASFLIEQIKKQCNKSSNDKSIFAYYYCYFGRNQDEAAPFLRWIICQLCRQLDFIPSEVQKLYKIAEEPSLEGLLTAVEVILQRCVVAYVVIDAMDESSPRAGLLKVIRDLATDARFSKIQILATSREYIDIERVMEVFSTPVTMANPLVEEDIRIVVRSHLDSNEKFKRWPKNLLNEVEETVTTGAKGMFRWAVCQLDVLQRLKCERNIVKNALATLPKTLDKTYERLFLCIPKEEWSFVHRALQWVHYHNEIYDGEGMPCSILLDAVQDNADSLSKDSHDRFYDVDRLRELCGCLISISTSKEDEKTYFGTTDLVSFAHYTVREYLDPTRILKGPTTYFTIYTNAVRRRFTEIIIRQAPNMLLDKKWIPEKCGSFQHEYYSLRQDYDFYCIFSALFLLIQWREDICVPDKLLDAIKNFLDPSKPHFDRLCLVADGIEDKTEIFSMAEVYSEFQFFNVHWLTKPDETNAAVFLHLLLLANFEKPVLARKFLEQRIDKRLLIKPT